MSNDKVFTISIPSDDDGYILLQCEHCGEYFKVTANDIRDDRVLNIYCPACGLESDSYITEDVIELAEVMATNYAQDLIYDELKKLEKQTRRSPVQFKIKSKPEYLYENPVRSGIEALQIVSFPCCHRRAKIKPLLKMSGCCCPFCGVKIYDFE
jgi:hypothetical protein